jgi:Enoyl-CoA hydratase/isomerase
LKSVLDAEGRSKLDVVSGYELQLCFAGIIKRLCATDATVIAAVQGVTVGAGMALTLVADIRFASDEAAFHIVAVRVGITAGECGISYHLPRLIGASRAYELIEREDSCASVSSSSTGSFFLHRLGQVRRQPPCHLESVPDTVSMQSW